MGVLRVARGVGASSRFWRGNQPCLCPFHSCVNGGVLVVFGAGERVVGISKDSVLGIIFLEGFGDIAGDEEILVLFGEVGFGHGSAFSFVFAMDSLLEPVGDESA